MSFKIKMTKKILFWIDAYPLQYPLAYSFSKRDDFELFSIIDVPDKQRSFFEKQSFVNFKKIEFYHDHINTKLKPDEEYLSKFEEKYKINLWLLAYNERVLYNYNEFYNFSTNEVLSILESECKFFEKILDEIKPDYVIMNDTVLHQDQLFFEICKGKGIKTLLGMKTRFGHQTAISKKPDIMDFINKKAKSTKNRTWEELQEFLIKNNYFTVGKEFESKFTKSKKDLVRAFLSYVTSKNTNPKTHYTYFGRTKSKVVLYSIKNIIKKTIRQKFINSNFVKNIPENKFIFYTLHQDPERSVLISAPFYMNELEVIKNIVKSLPIGFKLAVKEHPSMNSRDWRNISFYKEIMKLPNVIMLHPEINPLELIKKSSMVISITGTSSLEAAFFEKPSMVFAETSFSNLPSIKKINGFNELPDAIRESLKTQIKVEDIDNYVKIVEENSFIFSHNEIDLDFQENFSYGGFLADIELPKQKMMLFLERNEKQLELLKNEYIKKMD